MSAWHRLSTNEESNHFGQRTYVLPITAHSLGKISSISIRIDHPELAASSMPYYLCVHGSMAATNESIDDSWNGCAYMQPSVGSKDGADQQYPLRDRKGKLI